MWRLFPKTWFRSQGRQGPEIAKATRELEAQWSDLLAAASARAMKRETITGEEAVALLPTLLPSLAREIRRGWHTYNSVGDSDFVPALQRLRATMDPDSLARFFEGVDKALLACSRKS
jgi:hypothetical protein